MDPTTLVSREQVEAGRKLLERLSKTDLAPTAALWVRKSEETQPHLYVVSPLVERKGSLEAYPILSQIRRDLNAATSDPFAQLDSFVVKLLSPSHPLAKGVLEWYEQHPDDHPTFHRGFMGDVAIEAAYSYPATMFAAPAAPSA